MNNLIPHTEIPYTGQEQLLLNARSTRTTYFTKIPWQYFTTHFITRPSSDDHRRGIWYEYLKRVDLLMVTCIKFQFIFTPCGFPTASSTPT
jgi:hypothetical protein